MVKRFIKHINLVESGYSYLRSSVTQKASVRGLPLSISAELTNNCNLKCPQCFSGSGSMKRERGFMDIDLFKKVMKELGPYLYYVNLYFQGEPMLHPQFITFVEQCTNTYSVVSTNGHFLSSENSEKLVRSRLNKLIISLDGLDQDTYSSYRVNGSMIRVIEGLNNVVNAKKAHNSTLRIELQLLVNRINEHMIPHIKQLAKSVNAQLNLKSMQILDHNEIGSWLPSGSRFRRYTISNGEYKNKNTLPDRCARLWFNPVITWDGKIVPCCFDKDGEYVMGDISHDSFRDIWEGPKYRIFRKSILTGRHLIDICRNCTSGLRGVRY